MNIEEVCMVKVTPGRGSGEELKNVANHTKVGCAGSMGD
jgi:hypothetical protein